MELYEDRKLYLFGILNRRLIAAEQFWDSINLNGNFKNKELIKKT